MKSIVAGTLAIVKGFSLLRGSGLKFDIRRIGGEQELVLLLAREWIEILSTSSTRSSSWFSLLRGSGLKSMLRFAE